MPEDTVKADYISHTSARTAPRFDYVDSQKYAEPEHVTFKVPGSSRFTVELTRRTRERVAASGGIQGRKGRKGQVQFDSDYDGIGIPSFAVHLKRSRTPPPPRRPSYPKPLTAHLIRSRYHSHPSGYMAHHQATFAVVAHGHDYSFNKLMTGATLNDLKWNGNKMHGLLDANGIGTFKLPGYGSKTFERELWDHDD